MDNARPKATTAEYTALVKAERIAAHKCVDCTRKAWLKPDGTYARKCRRHLDYDAKRYRDKRDGVKPEREREYVRRATPILTRADRRRAYENEGRCACGQERDHYVRERDGITIKLDDDGRPVLARSCSRCLSYRRGRYSRAIYCTSCQAYGFHRADCSTLKE